MGNDELASSQAGPAPNEPTHTPRDPESPRNVGSQSDTEAKHDVVIDTGKATENVEEDKSEDKGGFGAYVVSRERIRS